MVKPFMKRVYPLCPAKIKWIHMAGLCQPKLPRHIMVGKFFPPIGKMVRFDIIVIQAVDNENTGIDLISIFHKVALIPKVIIVASLIVSFRPDFFSDKCAFFNTVTAGDGSRQAARPIWIKWN